MSSILNKEAFLSLKDVFSYLNATLQSRTIIEGEQLLNARHLILCGITNSTDKIVHILSLCLQTSGLLNSKPHEISGTLVVTNDVVGIQSFQCTCKAGMSRKCKHITATLLKCTRGNILALEKLSSTDIQCYWSTKKPVVERVYEGCPIMESSCLKPLGIKKCRPLGDNKKLECFTVLTSICKSSALSKHVRKRKNPFTLATVEPPNMQDLEAIFENIDTSTFLPTLQLTIENYSIRDCCINIYRSFIVTENSKQMAHICIQGSEEWKLQRKFRLTGSRCYGIFTYSGTNWARKSVNYFYAKTFSNKYVKHGTTYEKEALNRYKHSNKYEVYEPGLVICQLYPWLAYSPDGVVMKNGKPVKLLEVKCPYSGKEESAINFIRSCNYLVISEQGFLQLKKKHAYYGQIQLGMALLHLPECDFVIYSSKSKSFLNVIIPFDINFAKSMIEKISYNYFTHMIHGICTINNK